MFAPLSLNKKELPLLLQNQQNISNILPNVNSESLEGIKYPLSLLLNKKIKDNNEFKINNKNFKHFLILFSKIKFKNRSL